MPGVFPAIKIKGMTLKYTSLVTINGKTNNSDWTTKIYQLLRIGILKLA